MNRLGTPRLIFVERRRVENRVVVDRADHPEVVLAAADHRARTHAGFPFGSAFVNSETTMRTMKPSGIVTRPGWLKGTGEASRDRP